ncbi:hypothetical protein N7527_001642 [Penicillium freii]|nr:hypothetical protein N7527_001642 [Penicillium freii]
MARGPELPPHVRERICELKRSAKWGAKRIQKHAYPHIPLSTIHYTLRQETKRSHGISMPRLGGPRKLTEEDRDRVYDAIQSRPDITREDLLAEVDYKVKAHSIWRLTHEMGLRKWRKMNRPYLTPIYAAKRLNWALTYRYFIPKDWKRVFWSDKTTVERKQGARKEWTFIPPKDQLQNRNSGIQMTLSKGKQSKQMFWACFSGALRKTGLIPLYGDPNAERKGITKEVIYSLYRGILPTLLANQDAIFQYDNAPTHTAYIVQELLREIGVNVMDWPPYSPDLNPIENLWALLKADILRVRPWLREMPNNQETWAELVDAAQYAWENLTVHHFVNLAETMPHRVEEVIKYEGWHTSY